MKPLLSRRSFCRLATLGPLASILPPMDSEPSAALLDEQGVRMLREGRTYEKAQAHFVRAAEKDPSNPDYQIALGCALASRVASLVWAGCFAQRLALETAAHPKWKTEVTALQAQTRQEMKARNEDDTEIKKFNDEVEEMKRKRTPPIGRVFLIKDDKAAFRMTPAELSARLTLLSKQALAAWEKGVALCKTPEEKAHAQYVQGWGMRLLRFYCEDDSGWRKNVFEGMIRAENEAPPPPLPLLGVEGLPSVAQINAAFREATETRPGVALYWQARADGLSAGELLNPGAEASDLYRHAASLEPKNANLWNRVYDRETTPRYTGKQANAPSALDDLHHAQARDKANAWYGYEEASRIFDATTWTKFADLSRNATEKEKEAARTASRTKAGYEAGKRAAALIARSNTMPRFVPPTYQSSLPVLLARAWGYVPKQWSDGVLLTSVSRLVELARGVRGYADGLAATDTNNRESVRVLRSVQEMGLRMMGDPWPTADVVSEENVTPLIWAIMGSSVVQTAYAGLLSVVKSQNDANALAAITRERDEWDALDKKWMAQIPENGMPPNMYDFYDRNQTGTRSVS